jgi:hypothetical protein
MTAKKIGKTVRRKVPASAIKTTPIKKVVGCIFCKRKFDSEKIPVLMFQSKDKKKEVAMCFSCCGLVFKTTYKVVQDKPELAQLFGIQIEQKSTIIDPHTGRPIN